MAASYLRGAGYRILSQNWRSGRMEIDLVAQDAQTIAFVEVKTRHLGPQPAVEAVDRSKRRTLRRAAGRWIAAHHQQAEEYRFDVIAITIVPRGPTTLEHVRGAFTGDDA